MYDQLTQNEFERMQIMQGEMIAELDRVCRAHGIRYAIFCGTLLGAVRHKAHIPWDDDADVAMLRGDYEAFKAVAHEMDSDICFFQDHGTDPDYLWGYGKLRRTGTRYVRKGQEHIKCQDGVYVDVFPLDDVPTTLLGQVFQDLRCWACRKILWAQVAGGESRGVSSLGWRLLSRIKPDTVYAWLSGDVACSSIDSPNRVRTLLFPAFGKLYVKNPVGERYGMKKEWFKKLAEYEFEGYSFLGPADYDGFLSYVYDDYMQLPPEDERKPKVEFSYIDLGHAISRDEGTDITSFAAKESS